MKLSVTICAHNSRKQHLLPTLESLQMQTLPTTEWELVLIDNASKPALESWVDLSWHPNARIVAESTLGLTHARTCAFRETQSELLVMVDDDNVLARDFLAEVLEINVRNPKMGAWGASIQGQFEQPVSHWLKHELLYLAIRPITQAQIAYAPDPSFPTPAGAGMCIRRVVINRYQSLLQKDPLRRTLDRKGDSLVSSGDTDLALCAWDLGLGLANFPQLQLTHLIPAERMQVSYIRKLHRSMAYSGTILDYIRNGKLPSNIPSGLRILKTTIRELMGLRFHALSFFYAHLDGLHQAEIEILKLQQRSVSDSDKV